MKLKELILVMVGIKAVLLVSFMTDVRLLADWWVFTICDVCSAAARFTAVYVAHFITFAIVSAIPWKCVIWAEREKLFSRCKNREGKSLFLWLKDHIVLAQINWIHCQMLTQLELNCSSFEVWHFETKRTSSVNYILYLFQVQPIFRRQIISNSFFSLQNYHVTWMIISQSAIVNSRPLWLERCSQSTEFIRSQCLHVHLTHPHRNGAA